MSFTEASRLDLVRPGEFTWQVPPGWEQGRGAFGGLVLGACTRAIEATAASPDRRLRALSGTIPAPVMAGPATIRVTTLRVGSAVSVYTADVVQGGEIVARATATLGRPRPDAPIRACGSAPLAPPWAEVPAVPVDNPFAPVFARHVEFRPIVGFPMSGAEPVTLGYVELREPAPCDSAALVALADAWWPTWLVAESQMRPTATVAFHLEVGSAPLPSGPVLHSARAVDVGDGYVVEHRELWSLDGRLLAANPQTFVIIR